MDDILGEGFKQIEHVDGEFSIGRNSVSRSDLLLGWPSMGLRFSPKANASHYLNVLLEAAAVSGGKFDVYTHETMPTRYNFSNQIHHQRIAPIYVVPKIGYVLTDHVENGAGMSKGVRMKSGLFLLRLADGLDRITVMTMQTHQCMRCSLHMVHSPPLSKQYIRATKAVSSVASSRGRTRAGIRPQMTPT